MTVPQAASFVLLELSVNAPPNKALHLTGPALRFFETSRSLQPARQVNGVVQRQKFFYERLAGYRFFRAAVSLVARFARSA